jgi:transposase
LIGVAGGGILRAPEEGKLRRRTAMPKHPPAIVKLTEEERAQLHTLIGRGIAPARTLTHARVLLKANRGEAGPGWTDAAIAVALEVGLATVARVRQAYVTEGLTAALERKAPNRVYARKLDGKQEAHLIALTCSDPPAGRQRWTLRLLAEHLVRLEVVEEISYETVRQTLKQTNSNPG